MKQLLLTSTIIAISALPLSAQEVAKSGKFASIVKNIGNALNIGQGEEAVESEVNALAVDAANAGLDQAQRLQRPQQVHSLRSQRPPLLAQC